VSKYLQNLRARIKKLQSEVQALRERRRELIEKAKKTQAKIQARLFLQKIFIPYLEGVSEGLGLPLEEGAERLIREGRTIADLAMKYRGETSRLLSMPETRMLLMMARPIREKDEDWVREKSQVVLDVMGEVRPSLAKTIKETQGGVEWFQRSLIELKKVLFG